MTIDHKVLEVFEEPACHFRRGLAGFVELAPLMGQAAGEHDLALRRVPAEAIGRSSAVGPPRPRAPGLFPAHPCLAGATAVAGSYDFVFDQTGDGRRLKGLPLCDEFSRELVALEVERRMESKDVIRILDEAVIARGSAPEFMRSDDGPEFVALAVQDSIQRRGFKTLYIPPGCPVAERLQRAL